ncbi:MAG: hypothetical protein ACE5GS_12320 [Kiloniellaceae bacterium]
MDSAFLHAAIVWGALGVALACLVLRLKAPPPPAPGREAGAAEREDARDPA